jgi:hypothetical protein
MSDMKALMELMNAFNQGGPGNQFSQTYNPAAQYGPRSSPMPSPQGVGTPPGIQTDNKMLQMLNPRMFGPGEQGSAPSTQDQTPDNILAMSGTPMGSPGGAKGGRKSSPQPLGPAPAQPQGMASKGGAK